MQTFVSLFSPEKSKDHERGDRCTITHQVKSERRKERKVRKVKGILLRSRQTSSIQLFLTSIRQSFLILFLSTWNIIKGKKI